MSKNPYFAERNENDITLYEDLIIEAIQIFGHDVYYLPMRVLNKDRILNDIRAKKFDTAYLTEIYVESVDDFEGDGKLIAKFGLEIRDQLRVAITRRRWEELVKNVDPSKPLRPFEGDLIYFPLIDGLFEVRYTNVDSPFYQLSNLPVYKLTLELYEFSSVNTKIDTGIEAVDAMMVVGTNGQVVKIEYDSPSELFAVNDGLYFELPSGITGEAKVLRKNAETGEIFISNPIYNDLQFHRIVNGTVVTNEFGTATGTLTVSNLPEASKNDAPARNSDIQTEAEKWVDFSENNPFGDIRF